MMRVNRQERQQARNRPSLCTLFKIVFVVSILFCIFYFRLRDFYYNYSVCRDQCRTEITNAKSQLDSVMEYKGMMETLMSKLKKECKLQIATLQEFYNDYLLMKERLYYCELEVKELEIELETCKTTPG